MAKRSGEIKMDGCPLVLPPRRSSVTFLRSTEMADLKLDGIPALNAHFHGTKRQQWLTSMSPG